jgi:hypothetical protein
LEPLSGHLAGRVVVTLPATRFSIQIFHILSTQCIYAFGNTKIIAVYGIIRFDFLTESENVYLAVRTEFLNAIQGNLNL